MWGTKETASCIKVMRILQSYLDGHTDEVTARRVAKHLEACRRCGLEAATYRELKASLARQVPQVDAETVGRLRAFGQALALGTLDEGGSWQTPPPA
jgi:anti-sigma factor RsiW